MSPYEGLNLPQLMELMHGLEFPEPVPWVAETPGWWVLSGWLLAVLGLCVRQLVLRRRRNRYQREAMVELSAIQRQAETDPAAAAAAIAALLKRTALVAYPREQVASLFGSEWARFLTESANDDPVVADAAGQISAAAYRADADGRSLLAPARRWIRVHRA